MTDTKPVRLKNPERELLLRLATSTAAAPVRIEDRTSPEAKRLISLNYVLFDETSANGNSVNAVLSEAGAAKAKTYDKPVSENARGPLPKPEDFEIETGIELPDFTRNRVVRDVYPFDKVPVGGSFFIPATERTPEPWKSKASTLAARNRKVAAELAEAIKAGNAPAEAKPPVFKINGPETKGDVTGARVYRVE